MTETQETCGWYEDDEGDWQTDCGELFILTGGPPSEHQMKFCCYCGRPLAEHLYVEEEIGDD